MGCDIHLAVETRWKGTPRWSPSMIDVPCWRTYALFAALADVRNYHETPVISEPKGLPDDISDDVRAFLTDYADHSYSWLSLSEALAYDWEKTTVTYEDGNIYPVGPEWWIRFLRWLDALWDGHEVRLVFGFDS